LWRLPCSRIRNARTSGNLHFEFHALDIEFLAPQPLVLTGAAGAGRKQRSRRKFQAAGLATGAALDLPDLQGSALEQGALRDATRGGLATVLNEIADASQVGIEIDEAATPIREDVKAFCEILGLDPLYLANEGKIVVIVAPEQADAALAAMGAHPLGGGAGIIGRVSQGEAGRVTMRTVFGGRRIVDMLVGEQLPRIC